MGVLLTLGFVKCLGCFLLVCLCVFRSIFFFSVFVLCFLIGVMGGVYCVSSLRVLFFSLNLLFWARLVGRACLSVVVWIFWCCVLSLLLLVCGVFLGFWEFIVIFGRCALYVVDVVYGHVCLLYIMFEFFIVLFLCECLSLFLVFLLV